MIKSRKRAKNSKNGSKQRNGETPKSYEFTKTPCIGTKNEISK